MDTKGIFVSYRRDESAGYAGRIADRLVEHFGEDKVFRDINWLEPGLDFSEAIERAIESSEVLIAVVGKNWLTVTDAVGQKRLENPHDYVRVEITTALKRNIRVVPLLIQGASMPSTDELPNNLAPLAHRNAFVLHDSSWENDVRRLISALEGIINGKRLARPADTVPEGQIFEQSPAASTEPDIIGPETIFVSYSRKDWEAFVEPLVNDLRQRGLRVWTDQTLIRGGYHWKDAIQEALDTCDRMVLCVSPDSLHSRYVRDEYRYFVDEDNKEVFPLICREARLPWDLKGLQYFTYLEREKLFERL